MTGLGMCAALVWAVYGLLFFGTRLTLLAEGYNVAAARDAQNEALRENCLDARYRDSLGTKAHICDEARHETAIGPLWRAVDHVYQHTYLCGSPCVDVATALVANPLNLVLCGIILVALPYVSIVVSRSSQHVHALFPTKRTKTIEDGYEWNKKDW